MGNRSGENVHVTYPCYRAKLTVDPAFGALPPLKAGPNADFGGCAENPGWTNLKT